MCKACNDSLTSVKLLRTTTLGRTQYAVSCNSTREQQVYHYYIHSWLGSDITSNLIPNRTVWSRWKALFTGNFMGPTPKSFEKSHPYPPEQLEEMIVYILLHSYVIVPDSTKKTEILAFLKILWLFNCFRRLATLNIFPYPVPHNLIGFSMLWEEF